MKDFKEFKLDDVSYTLKLMPAMDGLDLRFRLAQGGMNAATIFEVVSKCVQLGSVSFTEKKFNTHFKGRYAHLMNLVEEAIKFNFPDMTDEENPNVESDTVDE